MVVVSYSGKEINAKLVYYGAGLSGKTTNLESIYEAVPETSRGKMVSMKTQSDRTLFFDLLPLDLGEIMGFKTRFLLYTVPGQVFYNATRKLVLKGADAVVFVADSGRGKMDENLESLENLRQNLADYGLNLEQMPWALQYNKRDLADCYSVDELNAALNPDGTIPHYEAVANQGKGVFETFRGISHLLMEKVTSDLRRTPIGAPRAAREASHAASPRPASLRTIAPTGKPNVSPDVESPSLSGYGGEVTLEEPVRQETLELPGLAPEPALPSAPANDGRGEAIPVRHEPAAVRPEPAAIHPEPAAIRLETSAIRSESAVIRTEAAAAQPAVPRIELAPVAPELPAVDLQASPAQPSILSSEPETAEVVVPVKLPRNAREIVLRIVLE